MTRSFKNNFKYAIGIFLLVLLLAPSFLIEKTRYCFPVNTEEDFCLLLNSGLADCSKAKIQYMIWTKEEKDLLILEKILNNTGLAWHKRFAQGLLPKYSL
jgi:hypothetical protein